MGWRKEGKNESVKRRRERSQKWAKRGRKIKHRPQNLSKKGARIDQNHAKIDPKCSQNEYKTDKNLNQPRQDDLGPPWVAISRLSIRGYEAFLGTKFRSKFVKNDAGNHRFFNRPWKWQEWEKEARNHSKTEPEMVQNRAQKERQEENGKSVKMNNTHWF